jgi:hypothetical protein
MARNSSVNSRRLDPTTGWVLSRRNKILGKGSFPTLRLSRSPLFNVDFGRGRR